ncbi:MAG: hypothetical protein ACYS76_00615 [Planctomycetota bacterium]|jgi:hypothetical protein
MAKQVGKLIPNLKVEMLEPATAKGNPKNGDFAAAEELAMKFPPNTRNRKSPEWTRTD